ncbi:MAG: hypothetical protein MK209_09315, partial [Planctomycetes bacterium]|nr:hypothetical protein [Planctomycetota bacterium]
MACRLASVWMALLVLLGALHEGVHVLEHALHSCSHASSSSQHDHAGVHEHESCGGHLAHEGRSSDPVPAGSDE